MDAPAFRPDVFFDGAWRGWGVAKDLFGVIRARYTLSGSGETSDARRLFRLKETYAISDGRTEAFDWEIGADDEGAFYGREIISGAEGFGRQVRQDYFWVFNHRVTTVFGQFNATLRAHYTMVTPDQVVCKIRISRLGLPLITLHSCYQRMG